jgi:glycosyltransferase involved in cell wall biosynthesis
MREHAEVNFRGPVAFSANASMGVGGQGEFLRQMALALTAPEGPSAAIYARAVPQAGGIQVPFAGWQAQAQRAILSLPLVRGRNDWLAWTSDTQFDEAVAARIGADRANHPLALFDGVMAQCRATQRALPGSTRKVLTCLNTHVDYLVRSMNEEYARVGNRGHHFMSEASRRQSLEEIAAADHVRVNSTFAKQTFVDAGVAPDRISVIHPGVDLAHFHETPPPETFRVLAVATVDPRKGIHDLITAFERAALPGAELEIVGGTTDRWSKALIESARGRVRGLTVNAMDVMRVPVDASYGRASVLVHAAIEDGFGLVVPQALASGRPVIATSTAGASELIDDGRTGFVIPPRDPETLADRLHLLYRDHALRAAMSAAARPSVAHLTDGQFAREVLALYARLA